MKIKLPFEELRHRLTGIDTPIGGFSWNPPDAEIVIARRVIAFLEDRRVLYSPYQVEVPEHCIESVIDIRHYLTEELKRLPADKDIAQSLRALRASCRKFLERLGADEDIVRFGNHRGHWAQWVFYDALGQLRGVFGVHILKLVAAYGIDIEDDLASILPIEDEN